MTALANRLLGDGETTVERFPAWNFGIPEIDDLIRGVRAGFTNLLVARPHVGKTLLVMQGIRNNPDLPTMFISADDDPSLVIRKMMESEGVVSDGWDATPSQMAGFVSERYPNLDIVDDVSWGPVRENNRVTLSDAIERFVQTYQRPLGFLTYDYLGIDGNDFNMAISTAAWMKQQVKVLPMPVLTIAQSSRQYQRTMKGSGGEMVRRGFRMEDLSYGGEQQAGLIMGLTRTDDFVGGRSQSVLEIDVVKNKAVFDGSGLTDPSNPIILCHVNGSLVSKQAVNQAHHAGEENRRREAASYAFDDRPF